jgi:hypothetical protein
LQATWALSDVELREARNFLQKCQGRPAAFETIFLTIPFGPESDLPCSIKVSPEKKGFLGFLSGLGFGRKVHE